MRQQFTKYGDSISFDLTFQLVKNRHFTSNDRWKVGVFLGVSSCKHLVPLGIVLTLDQTADTYVKIFRTFFEAVRGQPKLIITDDEKAIGAALREMKEKGSFMGSHRLDLYHVLHNLRKRLTNKGHILLFSRLAKARNDQEFQRRLDDIEEVLPISDK